MEYDGGKSSGAVFSGSDEMAWLYTAVADLWAKPEARQNASGGAA